MEFSVDAAKILASKLDDQSLLSLKSTSKTFNDTFNRALASDYTYKLMVEELIHMDLSSINSIKWKEVYLFFMSKPAHIQRACKRNTIRWESLTEMEKKLELAVISQDVDLVRIGLLSGVSPSIRNNMAINEAIAMDNTQVLELLLGSVSSYTI